MSQAQYLRRLLSLAPRLVGGVWVRYLTDDVLGAAQTAGLTGAIVETENGHRARSGKGIMNERDITRSEPDDVEAHKKAYAADAEVAEDDVDVEGHRRVPGRADVESTEGDDDVEGHG